MPRFSIHAICRHQDFDRDPIYLEARLLDDGRLNPNGVVGYYADGDGQVAITHIIDDVVYFADDSAWDTNLLRRKIEPGAEFSIGDDIEGRNGEDYWVYRIDDVREITE